MPRSIFARSGHAHDRVLAEVEHFSRRQSQYHVAAFKYGQLGTAIAHQKSDGSHDERLVRTGAVPIRLRSAGCHPVGIASQVFGRGLVPRLSFGTLQLSIRCSSIHFLPSLSFPVSPIGPVEGKIAPPFGAQ